MEDEEGRFVCAGIPIPQQIIALRPEQSVSSLAEQGCDAAVRQTIQSFAAKYDIGEDEAQKARYLATGYNDVIILLQRPAKDHDYTVSNEDFVKASPVLRCLEETIRFTTNGARNIGNTRILDAFTFKPKGTKRPISDNVCHDFAQSLIELIRPDHILGCCGDIQPHHWLARFYAVHLKDTPCLREVDLQGKSVTCVRSFHPGYFVNHVLFEPRPRLAFILGVMLGFTHKQAIRDMILEVARICRPVANA
jgi:hypothetical protein